MLLFVFIDKSITIYLSLIFFEHRIYIFTKKKLILIPVLYIIS